MIKVVGFDLDNTLYNQELFEFEVFKLISVEVSKKYKVDSYRYLDELVTLYRSNIKEFIFDKAIMSLNSVLPSNWDNFIVNTILPMYRNFIPTNLFLHNGIENELKLLKLEDYKLVLITNGNTNVQNNKINSLNIRKLFDLILISDEFEPKRRKPEVFMFEQALTFFDITSNEMIFIGDDMIRDKASELIGIKFIHIGEYNFSKLKELDNEE